MESNSAATVQCPQPQGRYVPATRVGSTIRTAGMTPRRDGLLLVRGRVGGQVSVEQARFAAAIAVGNATMAARSLIGRGERLRVAEMTVYIACEHDFTELSRVADGASEALLTECGVGGLPARSAVGVYALPGRAPIEVALVAEAVAEAPRVEEPGAEEPRAEEPVGGNASRPENDR